jgi:hypothetical protein
MTWQRVREASFTLKRRVQHSKNRGVVPAKHWRPARTAVRHYVDRESMGLRTWKRMHAAYDAVPQERGTLNNDWRLIINAEQETV